MALEIKTQSISDVAGDLIYVIDKTGAYVADYNATGWGDPNAELSESCLMVYAERVIDGADNKIVEVVTSQFIYDNTAENTDEKSFQLVYDEDGQFNITVLRLKVSTDGINYVDGGAIQEGEYVFYSNALMKMESSVLIAVTDFSEVVGIEAITQKTCEILFTTHAIKILNNKRRLFKQKRDEKCEDLDPYRDVVVDISEDIASALGQFQTNLKTHARETIKKINEKYA